MKRILGAALLAVLAGAAGAPRAQAASSGGLPFIEDDYSRALAQARAKNVPIFLEAWAPW